MQKTGSSRQIARRSPEIRRQRDAREEFRVPQALLLKRPKQYCHLLASQAMLPEYHKNIARAPQALLPERHKKYCHNKKMLPNGMEWVKSNSRKRMWS
ncbi:hypothetical protein J6590_037028 [Homalodisca vitripennis]|nr:hypothetical protein J6590_037028 [Homalodisca vitripennis]